MRGAAASTFLVLVAACDGGRASQLGAEAAPSAAPSAVAASQGGSSDHATALPKGRVRFGTEACDACLAKSCNPYQTIPLWAECVDAKCEESFACFQRNRCATDADTVNQCFCGKGVSNDECLIDGFTARGPCAALISAANASSDTRTLFGLMYSSETSVGDGAALFRCGAELCLKECVTDPGIAALVK